MKSLPSIGVVLLSFILTSGLVGCNSVPKTKVTENVQQTGNKQQQKQQSATTGITPERYLASIGILVKGDSNKFTVTVPETWEDTLGAYPEGMYWKLANVYSKDAGFDLTPLKGTAVEVWRYALKDGLLSPDGQNTFKYPSNLVLLVKSDTVVGAWLAWNVNNVGPSIKKRYLKDITGLTEQEWLQREGVEVDSGINSDLASLTPIDLIKAFFQAINDGDKTRANACLSPNELFNELIINLPPNRLYNPGFGTNNSIFENILQAKLLSYQILDPKNNFKVIDQIGSRTEFLIAANLQMKWRDNSFNGTQTRFIGMTKFSNGWKINGLGTGP